MSPAHLPWPRLEVGAALGAGLIRHGPGASSGGASNLETWKSVEVLTLIDWMPVRQTQLNVTKPLSTATAVEDNALKYCISQYPARVIFPREVMNVKNRLEARARRRMWVKPAGAMISAIYVYRARSQTKHNGIVMVVPGLVVRT